MLAGSRTAQNIRQQQRLVVGGDLASPSLSQQNEINGQFEGFDATLANLLAKYLVGAANTTVVPSSADTRESLLEAGTVDVVIRIYSITPQRAERVSFAGPYLAAGQAIATLKTKTGIKTPADLRGATVVVVQNTTSVAAVRQLAPSAKLVTMATSDDCVLALEQQRADAYVHDLAVLAGIARLNDSIRLVETTFTSEYYGIGLKHGDSDFKRVVNEWLRRVEDIGLWAAAWRQSLGTVVAGDPPVPPVIGSVPGS